MTIIGKLDRSAMSHSHIPLIDASQDYDAKQQLPRQKHPWEQQETLQQALLVPGLEEPVEKDP
ncbi:hypothetical protein NC651_011787 [Populus alba x Populus x berolinensis]|nr:hypothetical protein NC651_011787 [Populus alba x Populus x berolinensis]